MAESPETRTGLLSGYIFWLATRVNSERPLQQSIVDKPYNAIVTLTMPGNIAYII